MINPSSYLENQKNKEALEMLKDMYRADGGGGGDGPGAGAPFVIAWIDFDTAVIVGDSGTGVSTGVIRVAFNKNVGWTGTTDADDPGIDDASNEAAGMFVVYDADGALIPTKTQVYATNVSGSPGYDTRQYAEIYPADGSSFTEGAYTVSVNSQVRNRASNPLNRQYIVEWDPAKWEYVDVEGIDITSPSVYVDYYGNGWAAGWAVGDVDSDEDGYFDVGYVNPGDALNQAATYEFAGVGASRMHAEKLARRK